MKNKKGFLQGALCGALAMLLVAGLVSCGLKMKDSGSGKDAVDGSTQKKVSELKELIDQNYMGDVDEKQLEEGIYKGFISGLDDPYSVYYDEEETKSLYETTEGEYQGIGAVLSQNMNTGIITLVQIYDDSPAMKAGLKDNDILYKVNGEEVTGVELTEVVSHIKGEKGTTVEMTVLRGADNEEVTVTATRDTVEAQTVKYRMMDGQIGYVSVSEFDSVTYDQYQKALKDLEGQGMKGLVVDLRNNPGGNLNTVCDMLDLMLPKGLIVYTEDKDGNRQEASSDDENQFTLPLAVLVNGNSASASEIYAGAIQDYGIGDIVGTQTYGKGVVQQIFDLKDNTCVKLTIAKYFTPKGRSINGKGITPDVEVEYEADENNPEADNQLDKAVETIKNKL
ncbi:S41 family peptidase [[Clostridium] scindens]|uniref:S41 family peptidase n=1 Tax=Clostridium scindens (strain JCM 10418 / VPI 12708) TaxID=29347 RepID=UPI00156D6F07|nr:S41 family peptidase [[Clostridium] scindens]NSI88819.1 S41 family peptidase [[Clostridium] scindens]NSJ03597.1 S41 family peptidase [[Clostridium] scindens]